MKDGKGYLKLEMESFDEYVESKVGIKKRQAYKYISVFEKLGSGVVQSNAQLGIEKLAMLTEVPLTERSEFIEGNDINSISTRELKELIEKNKKYEEQLGFFENEKQEVKDDKKELEEKLKQSEAEKIEMEKRLKELESKPVDVVVEEVTEKQIEELKAKIQKETEQQHQKEIEAIKQQEKAKSIEIINEIEVKKRKEKEEIESNTLSEFKKALEVSEKEKASLLKRTEEMSKEMKMSTDGDIVEFQCYFENLQSSISKLSETLERIKATDKEKATKLAGALIRYTENELNTNVKTI